MNLTILLTATGGGLSACTVQSLKQSRRHDVRVVAVNAGERPAAAAFADAFVEVPLGNDNAYVAAILDTVSREHVDLILPCSDEEAIALASARDRVESAGARLACADIETLLLMADKPKCFARLSDLGIPVPSWRLCETAEQLENALDEFGGTDLAIKPARGRGNRGIFVVDSGLTDLRASPSGRELHMSPGIFRECYLEQVATWFPVLVCERLSPPCYDIDVLSWNGKVHRTVARQRLNPEGMPFHGNIVSTDTALQDIGRRVGSSLGLSWLYDVDVMTRPVTNEPVVIEINPRPSGSLAASVVAGVPLLDDLISLFADEPLAVAPPVRSTRILPYTSLVAAP